jgi:hypothetical protein
MIVLFVLMLTVPVMAKKPTTFDVELKATWFHWGARAGSMGSSFGVWTNNPPYWDDQLVVMTDLTLTGNVIHKTLLYDTPVAGASTVYVYNKAGDLWIQHEAKVNCTSPYTGLPITEYMRGYLKFNGTPSPGSFVHGVMYRWSYVYGVDETTVQANTHYPKAVWDATMDAWLVAFDLYLYDSAAITQSYTTPFPSPFIEPVPASNYNPLNL